MAAVDNVGNKWSKGDYYGPILSQTDLYLLGVPLELNPILKNTDPKFHLSFDLTTGQTVGIDMNNRDRDIPFTQRDQPATLPRVEQLIIITPNSPWCTIINNDEKGVTLGDVCIKLWQDYSMHTITDGEFNSLPGRLQETVRRFAHTNSQPQWGQYQSYYQPSQPPSQIKRFNWLRDRKMFDLLTKEGKDQYIQSRLGYAAPNIFVMELTI